MIHFYCDVVEKSSCFTQYNFPVSVNISICNKANFAEPYLAILYLKWKALYQRKTQICVLLRLKLTNKQTHLTIISTTIKLLSKMKWKETWRNCLFLSEAVFVVEGVDSFVNCYHADCGSWVACDGEAECLPRHCGSSWVWNHLQLQQFCGKRKGFLFIMEKTLKPSLCFYKFKHS